jgi:hypothetical protein
MQVETWCKFTVKGRGPFPVDMLRYDQCIPYQPDDTRKLEADATEETREVTLTIPKGAASIHYPTVGRWSSFGWNVLSWDRYVTVRGRTEHYHADLTSGEEDWREENTPMTPILGDL